MWEPATPSAEEFLRQGDLILGHEALQRGEWTFEDGFFRSATRARAVLVVDHCCTVEQRQTVTLCAVGTVGVPSDPNHQMHEAIANRTADPRFFYSPYQHPLDPLATHLPAKSKKQWLAKLEERFTLTGSGPEAFSNLQQHRVARMTPLGRAYLRTRLRFHFGRTEDGDRTWLAENGFSDVGEPLPVDS